MWRLDCLWTADLRDKWGVWFLILRVSRLWYFIYGTSGTNKQQGLTKLLESKYLSIVTRLHHRLQREGENRQQCVHSFEVITKLPADGDIRKMGTRCWMAAVCEMFAGERSLLGEWNAGTECDLRQHTSIFDEWEGGSKKGKERQWRRDNEVEVEVVTRPVVQGGILRTNREHVVSSKMDCRSPVS